MYDFNSLVAEAYMEAIKELLSSEMFIPTWDIGHSLTGNREPGQGKDDDQKSRADGNGLPYMFNNI